jgi:hypothetical protein
LISSSFAYTLKLTDPSESLGAIATISLSKNSALTKTESELTSREVFAKLISAELQQICGKLGTG